MNFSIQTTDFDKNYDELGDVFIRHVEDFLGANGSLDLARQVTQLLEDNVSPEVLGRLAEELGDFMHEGEGRDAI